MNTDDAQAPAPIAWCSWHGGLSETARLVQTGDAGRLFACDGCRLKYKLVRLGDQPCSL